MANMFEYQTFWTVIWRVRAKMAVTNLDQQSENWTKNFSFLIVVWFLNGSTIWIPDYLVWFSNGIHNPYKLVWFSNGLPSHLTMPTIRKLDIKRCPVAKCFLKHFANHSLLRDHPLIKDPFLSAGFPGSKPSKCPEALSRKVDWLSWTRPWETVTTR